MELVDLAKQTVIDQDKDKPKGSFNKLDSKIFDHSSQEGDSMCLRSKSMVISHQNSFLLRQKSKTD
jgi:hypothetical protein